MKRVLTLTIMSLSIIACMDASQTDNNQYKYSTHLEGRAVSNPIGGDVTVARPIEPVKVFTDSTDSVNGTTTTAPKK